MMSFDSYQGLAIDEQARHLRLTADLQEATACIAIAGRIENGMLTPLRSMKSMTLWQKGHPGMMKSS